MGQILRDELQNDPLGRGYAQMSDIKAANDLNSDYRTLERNSLSGDEMFQATVASEWAALSADQKGWWLSFCGRASVDPWAQSNVDFVKSLFGDGSTTVSNLADLRTSTGSRAEELGLGIVREGDVSRARS